MQKNLRYNRYKVDIYIANFKIIRNLQNIFLIFKDKFLNCKI